MVLTIYLKSGINIVIHDYESISYRSVIDEKITTDFENLKIHSDTTYLFNGSNQVIICGEEISYIESSSNLPKSVTIKPIVS